MILRQYQQDDLARILTMLREAKAVACAVVEVAPPIGLAIRTLFLAHRRELIQQSSVKLAAIGIPHGIIAAGLDRDHDAEVLVCSIQTLAARKTPIEGVGLLIIERFRGCNRDAIGEILPYFVRRLPGGGFSVRCPECARADGAKPILIGTCVSGPGDAWSRDDRAWFAAHPKRRWRLREPVPGELASAKTFSPPSLFENARQRSGFRIAIATYQIIAGTRMRHVVAIPTPDPLDSFTDAGICRLISGLTASMTINEDEAQRRYDAEREARLQALATIVKATAPS